MISQASDTKRANDCSKMCLSEIGIVWSGRHSAKNLFELMGQR